MSKSTSFILFSLYFLRASATPVERDHQGGIRIELNRRSLLAKDGVVDVDVLRQILPNTLAKYQATSENYKQNTGLELPITIGPIDVNITSRAVGADGLTDIGNGELWQGTISVGTPAVNYTVDFDTGSSDLFLPGPKCNTTCNGHTIYNYTQSSTSHDRHQTFSLAYGDGSTVSGDQFSDNIGIAGLIAINQTLGAASTYSSGFAKKKFAPDGLMGMAYQSLSQYNSPPVFQTFVALKQASQSVFAFKLAQTGSELFLGGTDSKLYTGSITYTPVTNKAYWLVNMNSVTANGKTAGTNVQSVIDTGTTLIIGDKNTVRNFYAAIPGAKDASATVGQGYYSFPCSSSPKVSFSFGGKAFVLPPSLFNIGQIPSAPSSCVGGIVASTAVNFWIVGDVFLQGFYSIFDLGNNQVGFATLR